MIIFMNENKEKISIKRVISNVVYILKYLHKKNSRIVAIDMAGTISRNVLSTIFDVYLVKEIIEVISDGADLKRLANTLLIMTAVITANILIDGLYGYYARTRIPYTLGEVKRELMEKAGKIDLAAYDNPEYFEDFIIAASQCEDILEKTLYAASESVGAVLSAVMAAGLLFTINPLIALFPVLGFIVNIITRLNIAKQEYIYNIERKKIIRKQDYSRRVFYQPEYAKEIKLTGIEDALIEQFNEAIEEDKKVSRKYGIRIALLSLCNWIFTFTFFSYFCTRAFVAYLAIVRRRIRLSDTAASINAAERILDELDGLNYGIIRLQEVGQYTERFRRFLDYPVNIEVCRGSQKIPEDGDLELKNVSFKYPGSDKFIINNVSMKIQKGEKTALVGENGAGKSTLIKLIMRLYDVTEGEITYGGVDIKKLDIREYRSRIGAVFQDFQIYGGTLAENVLMDNADEKDYPKINEALCKADFSERLKTLPQGLETELTREFSDKGNALSGGEAQKAAVARIFMRSSSIAILDEPSSALDPIAEYRLNRSMLSNAENKAVILISHRLSTTRDADRIILLENGSVKESGTHSELIENNGEYAKMWNVQAEKYCMYSRV